MIDPRNPWRFAVVAAVLGAHTLRNFSPLYLLLYAIVALWTLICFLRVDWRERLSDRGAMVVTWLVIAATGAVMTAFLQSPGAAADGLSRFLFAIPILFALVAWTNSRDQLVTHACTLVAVFTLQALTLPLQFVTGPLPFLAAAEQRGGLVRYSSAVGSVTSIGIIVGCYLILAQLFRPAWRFPLMVVLSAATVVSLSKAAIANVVIAWIVILLMNRRHRRLVGAIGIGIPALVLLAYATLAPFRERISTSLVSFGVEQASGHGNGDVDIVQSILQRVTELPGRNYAALAELGNPLVYLFGGGYGMGDTALVGAGDGLTIMAHNQLIESITVFGLLGGLLQWGFLALVLVALLRRWRGTGDRIFGALALAHLVFLVNSIFANGTLYNPMSGAIVWLVSFAALSTRILDVSDQGVTHAVP